MAGAPSFALLLRPLLFLCSSSGEGHLHGPFCDVRFYFFKWENNFVISAKLDIWSLCFPLIFAAWIVFVCSETMGLNGAQKRGQLEVKLNYPYPAFPIGHVLWTGDLLSGLVAKIFFLAGFHIIFSLTPRPLFTTADFATEILFVACLNFKSCF